VKELGALENTLSDLKNKNSKILDKYVNKVKKKFVGTSLIFPGFKEKRFGPKIFSGKAVQSLHRSSL